MRESGEMADENLALLPDWRDRVQAALAELDRRCEALAGATIVPPTEFEQFEMLLRVAQGDELPRWEGPPLPDPCPECRQTVDPPPWPYAAPTCSTCGRQHPVQALIRTDRALARTPLKTE